MCNEGGRTVSDDFRRLKAPRETATLWADAALAALGASSEDGGASGESRTLTLKLLARRGFAYCQLQRFEDAQGDYGKALEIDPHSEQLQKDYAAIGAPPSAMFVRLKTYESAGGKP